MPGLTLSNATISNSTASFYQLNCFSGNVLVLAGGGGGSVTTFTGGGAGGMLECTSTLFLNVNYNVSIGAGGAAGVSGSNSYFCINNLSICPLYNFNIETCGGGGGTLNGGSGGGFVTSGTITTGVPGQGTAGCCTVGSPGTSLRGAGGGAGSSPPAAPLSYIGGGGRATKLINGNDYFLGGGGAGGVTPSAPFGENPVQLGGCGGGGSGAGVNRTSGLPNSGGGGGGGYPGAASANSAGGSGLVVVAWCSNQNINYCVSPALTYCPTGQPNWTGVSILSGTGTICFFKVPECVYPVDVLVVGGGGSGGGGTTNQNLGGGGGAGGVILGSYQLKLFEQICLSVGAGGSGTSPGSNGTGSCFGNFCALGGGRYGCCGGSAGGASRSVTTTPGIVVRATDGILNTCTFPVQGCRGGGGTSATTGAPGAYAGAGGGANQNARLPNVGSGPPTAYTPSQIVGGNGCLLDITGISTYYGGGGGGYIFPSGFGAGGCGGGGSNSAGVTNTGGGGSSRASPTLLYGGGSGIIVVAYANTIPDSLFTGITLNPVVNPTGAANTTNRPGYKVYEITGGTGTMQLGT